MTEAQCVVTGRVQGVGYRDYVQQAAHACMVCGYATNQADGSVRVCAQGTPDAVKDFIEYLHEGSVMSQVAHVAVEWCSVEQEYDDFSMIG